jgi:hypothetical protein
MCISRPASELGYMRFYVCTRTSIYLLRARWHLQGSVKRQPLVCIRRRTSDDVDELVRDRGLATTVVLELQTANHLAGVLGGVLHGVATEFKSVWGSH